MTARATLDLAALREGLNEVQDELASGSRSIDSVLESVDPVAQYLYVVKALESVPGVGKVRARTICSEVGVAEHAHCGDLRADERREIIARIGQGS